MFGSWNVGKVFGIRLYVHSSFWLLPAFVLLTGTHSGGLSVGLFDVAVLLAVFVCVALHELGHALAARKFGIRTEDITLYPIGGVARLERIPDRPWPEIVIALAGPAVNVAIALVLGVALLGGNLLLLPESYTLDAAIIEFLVRVLFANVGLVIFNMIPAFPMDGGRVLRAGLRTFMSRESATNTAATVGLIFAVGMGVIGLLTGQLSLVILAFVVGMMGQQEAAAVRQEEAYRRDYDDLRRRVEEPRRWYEYEVPIVFSKFGRDFPAATSERHADGWEYDPRTRMWTEWRDGYAIRRTR